MTNLTSSPFWKRAWLLLFSSALSAASYAQPSTNSELAILSGPLSQQCFVGASVTLSVVAGGPPPITYQWEFSGTNLPGCTNSFLSLTNVQLERAGTYSVVVSDPLASVTSAPALLYVSPYQVQAWGTNAVWGADVPRNLDLVAISVGGYYYLALRSDGTAVSWGPNGGQMAPPADLTNLVAIASGGLHNLGLKADGNAVAWDGTGHTPVPSGLTNVVAIAAGLKHNLALAADGTVAAWGDNTYGQLDVPVDLTNVVAIAGGVEHSLAVTGDGKVVGWGGNDYGQNDIPPDLTNVVAVAAGNFHSLALRADGTVAAWGRGNEGETLVPAGLTNVVTIAAGGQDSLALAADNTVVAWGDWGRAQSLVPEGLTNVVAIAGGEGCTMVLLGSGPPFLTSQLANRTVAQNATANFRATASGSLPLHYQWQFNGANIPGATNGVLSLTNVQPEQAGAYSILVTNAHGATASTGRALLRLSTQPPPGGPPPSFVPGSFSCHPDGTFQFTLSAATGSHLEILVSTNLLDWASLATLTATNSLIPFIDTAPSFIRRFYRAKLLP